MKGFVARQYIHIAFCGCVALSLLLFSGISGEKRVTLRLIFMEETTRQGLETRYREKRSEKSRHWSMNRFWPWKPNLGLGHPNPPDCDTLGAVGRGCKNLCNRFTISGAGGLLSFERLWNFKSGFLRKVRQFGQSHPSSGLIVGDSCQLRSKGGHQVLISNVEADQVKLQTALTATVILITGPDLQKATDNWYPLQTFCLRVIKGTILMNASWVFGALSYAQ